MRNCFARYSLIMVLAFALMALGTAAFAHTPICTAYDNMDGTATCEGGFSDGSSAAGVAMRVLDADGKVLIEGAMDDDSTFTFEIPEGDYVVVFDAGPGHKVEIKSSDIF